MPSPITRRRFLGTMAAAAAAPSALAQASASANSPADVPIIDTHIHLFDTTRPQGVPWPARNNVVLYKPALPDRYRGIAVPLGIRGAIEVECSPWVEDNQWVLDVAEKDPIMVGVIGNLEPGKPEFRGHLDRLRRNPLFRGIRYGNLWGRNLAVDLSRPGFVDDLKALADAGLVLDTANPDPTLIEAIVRVTDQVPTLRVIIDHLPKLVLPQDPAALAAYRANLRRLGERPQVYVKVSSVLRRINGRVSEDLSLYRGTLDELWETFGEDRLVYGSDWPNSDQLAQYPSVLAIVREYFAGKSRVAQEKYFWRNSVAAYAWVRRDPGQPALSA